MASTYQRNDGTWDVVVELERSPDGSRRRRHFSGATQEQAQARMAAAYPDPVRPAGVTAEDWEAYYDDVERRVVAEDRTDSDTTNASFHWGEGPVGLLLWSDWHVGSRWTNYKQLREDVEHVRIFRQVNPGALHLAHLGDIKDNYFPAGPHPTGMAESVIPRTDKQEGAALWLAKRAGDWDAMLLGCHLAWDLTKQGRDSLAPIADALGAVNGGYGLSMDITVGNQNYLGLIRHKPQGGGGMAPGNAHRRLDNEYGPAGDRADFIGTSHQHTCHIESYEKAGRHVVFTRSGGYKGGDCFARAGGFTHTKPADCGVPLLIFHGDRHHIQAFGGHDWRAGLDYLASLRRVALRRAA